MVEKKTPEEEEKKKGEEEKKKGEEDEKKKLAEKNKKKLEDKKKPVAAKSSSKSSEDDVIELLSDDDDDDDDEAEVKDEKDNAQTPAPVSSSSYFVNFLKTAFNAAKPSSTASAKTSTAAKPSKPSTSDSTLLVYPATGRARISVTHQDLLSLDPGKELNDTIIDFYMRYIVEEIVTDADLRKRVHVFST